MKTSLLSVAVILVTALPLWACQSTNAASSTAPGDTRQINVGGQDGGERVVTIPQDRTDTQAPYALRGDGQARNTINIDAYRRLGTNGS